MSVIVRMFSWGERLIVPFNEAITQFIRHLKQHAFESYFSVWIISDSSQDRNQPKVNYEDRTKSFLTDGNCESAMEKNYYTPRSAMERFPLHS